MAVQRKRTKRADAAALEDMNASQRIAHDILTRYRDLAPSVDRIMQAGLNDDECERAMTLFQQSLGNIGDPHRDPRVAIANSGRTGAGDETPPG